MDWDRRTFVKFAVGAAMGLGASPLMPKLTDDIAIWTQNWSWVPNPETGAVAFAQTVNPATGTGVKVRAVTGRIKGKRLIRVEGNPEHPLSRGGVIPADASALQLLYYQKLRVPGPMMRNPRIGAPSVVKAETALAYAAERLSALKKAGKAHTVAAIGDSPDTVTGEILARMFLAFGSPNVAFEPDADQTLSLAGTLMMGQDEIGFDLDNADCIISFGTPFLEGFGAPVAVRKAFARLHQAKGRTLIQVEPRASVTASQADLWLACKPGTEAAVALGICHLLIKNKAYDQALETRAVFGFDDLPNHDGFKSLVLNNYSPKQVAEISGVSPDQLTKAAQIFVNTKKAVAVCGPDASGSPGRLFDFMSVLALNAVKGNLGRPGGVVVRPLAPLSPLGEGVDLPEAPPVDAGAVRALAMDNLHAMAQGSISGNPYKIEALVVVGCNPLLTGPQANVMRDFLKSVPFVVAITPFMDETASLADVVLPAATFLEGWGDCAAPYGCAVPAYGLHRPLVKAVEGARSASDWLLQLAKVMGGETAGAVPFKDAREALQVRTKKLGDFKKLAETSYWAAEKPAYGPIECKTPSGKFEFFSMALHERVVELEKSMPGVEKLLKKTGRHGKRRSRLYAPLRAARGPGPGREKIPASHGRGAVFAHPVRQRAHKPLYDKDFVRRHPGQKGLAGGGDQPQDGGQAGCFRKRPGGDIFSRGRDKGPGPSFRGSGPGYGLRAGGAGAQRL